MKPARLFLVLALAAAPAPDARSAGALVSLGTQLVGCEASSGATVEIVAESISVESEPRAFTLPVSGPAELRLPDGLWTLSVGGERFWAPPATLRAEAGVSAEMTLYCLGSALVTVDLDDRTEPDRVVVDFVETAYRDRDDVGLRGRLDCRPAGDRWACPVPVGVFDLALRAKQHAPRFLWERSIHRHPAVDLGRVALERGASLTGEVRRADGEPVPKSARVRLERPGRKKVVTAEVSPWGFFLLSGLEPGDYRLRVEAEGFADAIEPVRLQPNTEAGLLRPLVLRRPVDVTFRLEPPHDLVGEPWRLDLLDQAPLPSRVAGGRTDDGGLWRAAGLAPGDYRLLVSSADGSRVATHELAVDESTDIVSIEIASVWVEGRVTLGDEPLSATLSFGGRDGIVSVSMVTDDDGRYTGLLPRDGAWAVDVESSDPKIFRRLGGVEVDPLGGSVARVDIELPDTLIEVEVVDSLGEPVPGASVFAMRWEPPFESPSGERVDEDGRLLLRGFAPGTFRLEALDHSTGTSRRSDAVEVILDEDAPDASARLMLRETVELTGRLVTARGSAVPGATIHAHATGGAVGLHVPTAESGADGRFRLDLPEGTVQAELTIYAPGFVLERVDVTARPGQEETIVLAPASAGGTLRLHVPPAAGRWRPPLRDAPELRRPNRRASAGFASGLYVQGRSVTADILEVPAMPAGDYSLCLPDDPTACEVGLLLPGLVLDLGRELASEPSTENPEPVED